MQALQPSHGDLRDSYFPEADALKNVEVGIVEPVKLGEDLGPKHLGGEFLRIKLEVDAPGSDSLSTHILLLLHGVSAAEVVADALLVLAGGLGLIEDPGGGDEVADVAFGEVGGNGHGHDGSDFGGWTGAVEERLVVENGGVGRLDVLGGVQQLLQPRHSQRHVLVRNTCQVEGVQRHLGRRLADRLRRHRTNGLASRGKRLVELGLNFLEQPIEALLADSVSLDNASAGQRGAQVHAKQLQSVLLLELPLLFEKLVFLALPLDPRVPPQQLLILRLALRQQALVDKLLYVFVDVKGVHDF